MSLVWQKNTHRHLFPGYKNIQDPLRKKKFAETKIKISNCYQDHWKFQLIKSLMNIKREKEREREAQQKLLVFHPLLDLD